MSNVWLKRISESRDDYVLTIGNGNVTQMIRITDFMQLYNLYTQGLDHEGGERDVVWTIGDTEYCFDWSTACSVYGTIESWFWEFAATA